MATPTMPDGCLIYSNFEFDIRTSDKQKFYIYAIVDCSRAPSAWDADQKMRPRRLSFSRNVNVTGTRNYRDGISFYGGETTPYPMGEADYTTEAGYQAFVDSPENYRPAYGEGLSNGREFGVLEFAMWDEDDVTPENICSISAVSCETINDETFESPGSCTRKHVERNNEDFDVDSFVSAYHIMWCLATSINRCAYEDRMNYCWPVFADRLVSPS